VRFALVGSSGFAAQMPAPALLRTPGVTFAGVLGSTPERGRALVSALGVGRAYSSFDQLVSDADVDAVWIAAHDVLHCPMTIAALRAGKHVLVEKPMAVSPAEGCLMVAEARRADRVLRVGTHQRFRPAFGHLRALVRGGSLGTIGFARLVFLVPFPAARLENSWRSTLAASGGSWATKEFGAHLIDQLLWWVGGNVELLGATASTLAHKVETEDTMGMLLRLPGGGSAFVGVSAAMATDALSLSVELRGVDDWAIAENIWRGAGWIETGGGGRVEFGGDDTIVPYVAQLRDFAGSAGGEAGVGATGEDGLAVLEVIDRALTAAGRDVAHIQPTF
jgi:predicted dehydrogenase